MKRFYLRDDFLEMIEPWLWGREIWLSNAPRPLKADDKNEFKDLIERYGVNEPFHFFLSVEIFSEPLKLKTERPESLRVSWDFFLDLDSEDFTATKRAAAKALKALKMFNVENYLLKFSGRRGFHLIIPGLSLDVFAPGEFRQAYPKLAISLAEWFKAVINEQTVKVDISVYKPRQLMRAPYSIHEETGLVSVPVENPLEFKLEDAKIESIKEIPPLPLKGRAGEAQELLVSLRDWLKEHKEELGLKIISRGEIGERKIRAYGWIEKILENPLDDGRHRLLWLVIAPYLVNIKGLPLHEAEEIAYGWLSECSKIKLVEGDLTRLAKYYVEYAARTGLRPLNLKSLKMKPEYRDLYEIIKRSL